MGQTQNGASPSEKAPSDKVDRAAACHYAIANIYIRKWLSRTMREEGKNMRTWASQNYKEAVKADRHHR